VFKAISKETVSLFKKKKVKQLKVLSGGIKNARSRTS
jgi:hypothetical protein